MTGRHLHYVSFRLESDVEVNGSEIPVLIIRDRAFIEERCVTERCPVAPIERWRRHRGDGHNPVTCHMLPVAHRPFLPTLAFGLTIFVRLAGGCFMPAGLGPLPGTIGLLW